MSIIVKNNIFNNYYFAYEECPVANCKKCLRSNLHVFHGGCEECSERLILLRGSFRDYCYTSCPEGYYETRKDGKETRICNSK